LPHSHKPPFASLAEAERLIRAGRALLSWPGGDNCRGSIAEAERCFRGALEILKEAVGSAHPQLALAWDRLGVLYEEMGDPEEAETCYLRSLGAQQAAGWSSALGQGLTVRRLARLYETMGKQSLHLAVKSTLEPQIGGSGPRSGVARSGRAAASVRHPPKHRASPNETRRYMLPPPRGEP
jgi:tetratricopeptide (TPR) repeat protein